MIILNNYINWTKPKTFWEWSNYLLELAHLFHNYYHHNKVLKPSSIEQSRGRLFLVLLIKDMFERCFKIIGISLPEKM